MYKRKINELEKRLKAREKSRNCGSDDFIKGQVDYQKYILKYLELYKLHLDNTNSSVDDIANRIIKQVLMKNN